jgi:hypothetical protein
MTPTTQTDPTHAAIRERHMQARRARLQAMMDMVAKNPTRTSEPGPMVDREESLTGQQLPT